METLIQSGPNSTPCYRITMIWITLVSRYLQKWPELHPWKMSHSCTKQEMVWNTPTQSCHCAHSYELDKFQFFFFKRQEQLTQADISLVWSSLLVEEPVRMVYNLQGDSVSRWMPVTWGESSGRYSMHFGARSRTSPWNTCSNYLLQPD